LTSFLERGRIPNILPLLLPFYILYNYSMKKNKKILSVIFIGILCIVVFLLAAWRYPNGLRPLNQKPTVVLSKETGPVFLDPYLHLQAPLPESMEAGSFLRAGEWETFTIVPVGNIEQLSTYAYIIEYRTRKKQRISDISVFLQNLYGTSFTVSGKITAFEIQQNLYTSSGPGEQYQVVHFIRDEYDILMVAKAKDANTQQQYGQAFVDFIQGFVEIKKQ